VKRYLTPALLITLAAVLATAPQFLGRGDVNDLWYIYFGIVLAASWNLLGGMAGQVSFGYSAFVGIGAYATVLLTLKGWNPLLTLPVGAVIAAAFSVAMGLPTFRLRGPYFSIATIGVSEAVRVYMTGVNWTGGASGKNMPPGTGSFVGSYYYMLVLCMAVMVVVWLVQRSRFGLALNAIRQDIDAAEALGINGTYYKVAAHALSAALVAMAGGLYAIRMVYVAPQTVFAFTMSLSIVLMPVIGGVGTLVGPIIGGVIFQYIEIKLQTISALRDSHLMIYGMLLIIVMLFEPAGFAGLGQRLWKRIRRSTAAGPGGSKPKEVGANG
jgi:branched-chain amino acid transport system permease protein